MRESEMVRGTGNSISEIKNTCIFTCELVRYALMVYGDDIYPEDEIAKSVILTEGK